MMDRFGQSLLDNSLLRGRRERHVRKSDNHVSEVQSMFSAGMSAGSGGGFSRSRILRGKEMQTSQVDYRENTKKTSELFENIKFMGISLKNEAHICPESDFFRRSRVRVGKNFLIFFPKLKKMEKWPKTRDLDVVIDVAFAG